MRSIIDARASLAGRQRRAREFRWIGAVREEGRDETKEIKGEEERREDRW